MSDLSICNQALSAAGARSTIASFSEDSNEARQCNLLFEPTRDQLMSMAPWDFSRFTRTLTLYKALPGTPENTSSITSTVWSPNWPAPPWYYSYLYPPDCLFARFVVPQWSNEITVAWAPGFNPAFQPARPMRFVRATDLDSENNPLNVILTNAPSAILTYTRLITNSALWSATFVQALVSALAGKLTIPLTGDKELAKGLLVFANDMVITARATDGNEGLTIQDTVPDWIAVRDTGPSGIWPYDFADPLVYPPLFQV